MKVATGASAFADTRRKLLDECELRCGPSLPGGTFSTAGTGGRVKLLFCARGEAVGRLHKLLDGKGVSA